MAGSLILRGHIWHGRWYINGREVEKTLRTDNRKVAEKRLNELVKKSGTGWTPAEDALNFEGLIEKVRHDREVRGRRCDDLDQRAAHLKAIMGTMRATDITTETVEAYVRHRLREKAKPATINRELALLRRGFALAEVTRKPRIQLLPENNNRRDFLDWPDFQRVRAEMPEGMRDVVTFMYLSSWRSGQVVAIEWRDVNMRDRVVTARGETTKSGEPHQIPLVGELWEIVERAAAQRQVLRSVPLSDNINDARALLNHRNKLWRNEHETRDAVHLLNVTVVGQAETKPAPLALFATSGAFLCPYVFHRDGEPFLLRGGKAPLRKAWNAACAKTGFAGHVLHCLRRSGVRNMISVGLDPMLAMKISGHKTMAMLSRYRIVDLKDQERGLEKLSAFLEAQPSESKVVAIGGKS